MLLTSEEVEKVRGNGPIQPLYQKPTTKPQKPEEPEKKREVPPTSHTAEIESAADKETAEEMETLASMQNQHGSFLSGTCFNFSGLV